MPTTTPGQSFPVPVAGDDPNIPDDLNNLAVAIERRVMGVYNSVADRDARVTAPQEGQVAYLKDTNTFTFHNGTAWTAMFNQPPTFSVGTAVPDNSFGSNGDVFFKV
jgi:hypothetical protein